MHKNDTFYIESSRLVNKSLESNLIIYKEKDVKLNKLKRSVDLNEKVIGCGYSNNKERSDLRRVNFNN